MNKHLLEKKYLKKLDEWWNTEPFGFDHPDTYNGIKKLLFDLISEIINDKMKKENAKKIVDTIIYDLTDRRGIKHTWFEIDSDSETQEEIKETWTNIVLKEGE